MSTLFLASFVIVATLSPVWGFQTVQQSSTSNPSFSSKQPTAASATTTNLRYSNWDVFETPDAMEIMIGGTRYEMVELPDSMMSTTLWVGNLCEFVTDEILSELFQQASSLKFVPACVARKPNMESMRYGFVAFRSEEEKEVRTMIFQILVLLSTLALPNMGCNGLICAVLLSKCMIVLREDCNGTPTRIRTPRQMSEGRIHQRPRKTRPNPRPSKDCRLCRRSHQASEKWRAQYHASCKNEYY